MARGDAKIITQGDEVRSRLISGAKKVYDAVAATYGPLSGNVAIQRNWGDATVTHDGVSVAREVYLSDEVEDMGAGFLVQASKKTNDIAGDGTSACAILSFHIMHKANQRIAAGYNPMGLRRGIEKASRYIKDELDKLATPIKDEDLHRVAAVSSGDEEIGKLVADTVVRAKGVGLTVEDYNGLGVIQDIVDGLYFEKGWAEAYFVTDRATEECVLENVHILVTDKKLTTNTDIVAILEKIGTQTEHKKVLIIGNVTGQALQTCGLTHIRPESPLQICVVNPPVYGDQVLPFLEDVAALTGGQLVPASLPPQDFDIAMLGLAEKIIVGRDSTTILEGKGDQKTIGHRISDLMAQLKSDKYTAFQRERMELRLAKLQGKIGIIKVGGATDSEREELKARVVDAVHSTRAAREEGIVPGGAVTLAKLSIGGAVKDKDGKLGFDGGTSSSLMPKYESEGFQVVLEALVEPFKQLMANAGDDGGYRIKQIFSAPQGHGFNVKNMTDEPIDLMEAGIFDPLKVIKQVVENACSVAGLAITTSVAITIDREYQIQQKQLNQQ